MKISILFGIGLLAIGSTLADAKPLALVYKGDGACLPCINGAAKVASIAGFDVRMVDKDFDEQSVFNNASLWIQPGGRSVNAAKAMGPQRVEAVRQFVAGGGGYVGFCAGGFLSTHTIGTSGRPGFDILPGSTSYHIVDDDAAYQMQKVVTPSGDRWVFFAGGPQFTVSEEELNAVQGQVTARTEDGQIVALDAHYGQGKVAVSGFHPEASALWKGTRLFVAGPNGYLRAGVSVLTSAAMPFLMPLFLWTSPYFTLDKDGDDYRFAVEMIQYATGQ